jgi:hypothetical protein
MCEFHTSLLRSTRTLTCYVSTYRTLQQTMDQLHMGFFRHTSIASFTMLAGHCRPVRITGDETMQVVGSGTDVGPGGIDFQSWAGDVAAAAYQAFMLHSRAAIGKCNSC